MKVEKIFLRNFLIIEKAVIKLSYGITTVTGETGSGKSLLISAMKALKGQRIGKNLVGRWDSSGEISAEIRVEESDKELKTMLDRHSIFSEDKNRLILKRVLGAKTGAYINDSPVSVNLLGKLFGDYIEIGSQFENRELFKKEYRLDIVDNFTGNNVAVAVYRELYKKMIETKEEIDELKKKDDPVKRDFLKYQLLEIEKLETFEGEYEKLAKQIRFLENRARIVQLGEEFGSLLESAGDKAENASYIARELSNLSEMKDFPERIKSVSIELDDIRRSFSLPSVEDEEMDPDEIRKRYDKISTALMKYSCTDTEELFNKMDAMQHEFKTLNETPEKISVLSRHLDKTMKKLMDQAKKLRETRLSAILRLEKKISGYLVKFGMDGVDFKIVLQKQEEPQEKGIDSAVFKINTIGSDELNSISSLSGGELSRLLLAVKLIDKEKGRLLLFDEIDSSTGGETAKNAAREMKRNSQFNQIVVVTHFPQTAVFANEHLLVEKKVKEGKMSVQIRKLNKDEKTREIARMMGDAHSEKFNTTASEMFMEE